SNSDSYRSVIDDLTIKNQKLKKRLKRLEELQAEHLQTDKLFELRIHGLSVSKRQELESLLQQFASTLHASPSSSSSVPTSASPPTSSGSPFVTQSVQTFDSAYASGMGGIHGATCANTSSQPSLLSGKSGDTNSISSSDHSKPSSLNKKDITFTSEKAKMKTVVKRLEQLFTGRQPRGQHARSPQDLMRNSQLSDESVPEEEGAREAPLMEVRPMNPTTASTPTDDSDLGSPSRPAIPEVVDQRPTRPGDLDPRRPQIPEQNLEYLHNLTTSSAPAELLLEDHWDGWVYLNLINNLAQLHTINVTLPFVKKAISTMSTKLELSPDGKMVRWKGGSEGSKLSSDSGSRSESASTGSPIDSQSDVSRGRKRDASISSLSDGIMGNSKLESLKFPASQESSATRIDFHYKPLFAQEKSTDDDSSDLETTSSASSDMKSSSSPDSGDTGDRIRTRKKTTGPIIFYENGNFCTDLSTQELRAENISAEYPYERMTNEVVGAPTLDNGSFRARNLKSKFPLQTVFEGETLVKRGLGESGNSEQDDEEDEGCVIDFSPTLDSTLPDHQLLPIELEASGIGGVQPEDNFAINVRGIIHRIPQSSIDVFLQDENGGSGTTRTSGRASHGHNPSPSPPHSTCSSSDGPPSPPPLRHEIVSARFIRLPPSSLPPALFYSPSSDESSRDSD
ncbi:frequency clock protein, partial [Peziza echinospora]